MTAIANGCRLCPPVDDSQAVAHPQPSARSEVGLAAVVVTAVVVGGMLAYGRRAAARPLPGKLTVETSQPGLDVAIDGQPRGSTPLTLDLPPEAT